MYSVKQIIKFQEIIFNPKKDKNDLVQSEIVWYLFYTAYLLVNKVNVFNIWKTVARSTNEFTMSIHVLHVHSNFLDVHVSIFYVFLLYAGNYMRYYEECLEHKIDIWTIK